MNGLAQVWSKANRIIGELDEWIATRDHKTVRLKFKPLDQARLLRLEVWSIRYKIGIKEILDLIMPILRAQVKYRARKNLYGLGISVSALCGNNAERILADELTKRYKDGENFMVWREDTRAEQLRAEEAEELDGLQAREPNSAITDYPSIDDYVAAYKKQVLSTRTKLNSSAAQRWRRRKHYRDNPWI